MGKRGRRKKSENDGFTLRDEANAITAHAFRVGLLEDLHSGKWSDLLESDEYSRITDAEMKKLKIESSAKVEDLGCLVRGLRAARHRLGSAAKDALSCPLTLCVP